MDFIVKFEVVGIVSFSWIISNISLATESFNNSLNNRERVGVQWTSIESNEIGQSE
jgi:hypothetical protein